jgi:hypothetical protein
VSLTGFVGPQSDFISMPDFILVDPGSFGQEQVITTHADEARSTYAADLDGDGDADVLSASWEDDKIAWYENTDGAGAFGPQRIIVEGGISARGATSVSAADLDGDGDLDALSSAFESDVIAWYENTDGLGLFGPYRFIGSQNGATSVHAADIDGDGDVDVLATSQNDDTVSWYENTDGLGSFGPEQAISVTAGWASSVCTADFDGDGDTDVIVAAFLDDTVSWYENTDGLGDFGPERIITTATVGVNHVFAADLDGDGDTDALAASSADEVAWFRNTDGLGTFGPKQVVTALVDLAESIFAADLDGDGDLDVLSASREDGKIAWYENTDGAGEFGPQQVISTKADGANSVYAVDLDGDGNADVLSASRFDDKVAWYRNLTGMDLHLVVGDGLGEAHFVHDEHVFVTRLDRVIDTRSLVDDGIATYLLPEPSLARSREQERADVPAWLVDGTFTIQLVGWKPLMPELPELSSNGLAVQVLPDGSVFSESFGEPAGLELRVETGVDEQGRRVLHVLFDRVERLVTPAPRPSSSR